MLHWRCMFLGHTAIQLDLSLCAEYAKVTAGAGGKRSAAGQNARVRHKVLHQVYFRFLHVLLWRVTFDLGSCFERTEPQLAAAAAQNPLAKVRKAAAGSLTHRHAWHRRFEPAQYVSGRNHQRGHS